MPRRHRGTSRSAAVLAGLAGLAVAAGLLSGCGGQGHSPSVQVAAYLRQVNGIERRLQAPLRVVTATSARVGARGSRTGPAAVRIARRQAAALTRGERQIRALEAQLAALPAPPVARHLRGLLVALVARQAHLTDQTARLVAFLPGYVNALRPLAPATLRLEGVLAVNQAYGASAVQAVYARKAAALRAFAAVVNGILGQLRRLRPPGVSLPGYRTQVGALTGMRAAAGQLADSLAAGRTAGLSTLLRRFDRAAAANGDTSVRRAQLAAVRGYDRQVNAIGALTAQAERERLRLAATLP